MDNSKKNVTLYYGFISAVYSIGFVTMSAFSSVYLLDAGLSNAAVGMLLAIGALIAVALQPVTGTLIDRNPKVSTKGVLLFLSILILTFGLLIVFVPNKSKETTSLLYGTAIFLLMLAQPFLNALGMDAVNNGYPINYGVGRSLGSLGYALGSYVFGIISVAAGPKSVPVSFSVAFFILCLLIYIYPVKTVGINVPKENDAVKEKASPITFFKNYKRFAVILVGLILIYFSHSLLNTFALQIITPKGGTSADMGTASAIAAVCELITTLLFAYYVTKVKLHILIKISGIFFTLKTFFSFVVMSVTGFFAIQGLQMFGWGLLSVGIVLYVNDMVGIKDKAQGQAYAGMSFTIASVLGNFLGGNIIDAYSVNVMLYVGTISALLGTVILWIFVNEVKKENTNKDAKTADEN